MAFLLIKNMLDALESHPGVTTPDFAISQIRGILMMLGIEHYFKTIIS